MFRVACFLLFIVTYLPIRVVAYWGRIIAQRRLSVAESVEARALWNIELYHFVKSMFAKVFWRNIPALLKVMRSVSCVKFLTDLFDQTVCCSREVPIVGLFCSTEHG